MHVKISFKNSQLFGGILPEILGEGNFFSLTLYNATLLHDSFEKEEE